jgi:hypothetical protein
MRVSDAIKVYWFRHACRIHTPRQVLAGLNGFLPFDKEPKELPKIVRK